MEPDSEYEVGLFAQISTKEMTKEVLMVGK